MRRAFGLPQAIMIILFIGSIALIGIKYTKVAVDHYGDSYAKEQAQLFLQSAKEWALFQISGYDRVVNGNCWSGGAVKLSDLVAKVKIDFNATVKAEKYFLYDTPSTNDDYDICTTLRYKIASPQSHGMVLLKITIEDSQGKIKLIDRSIQRP